MQGPYRPPLLPRTAWMQALAWLPPAGLESRFRNKCAYLKFSCASRIRTYLREVGPAWRGGTGGDVGLRCGR